MNPLALVLAVIGFLGLVCGGLTVAAGLTEHLVHTARRRDPLAPDRDRELVRRALAHTAHRHPRSRTTG